MKIVKAKQAPDRPNPHAVSVKALHSTEHVQVVMITLEPGESLKLHVTPVDAFFYGLEGEGKVKIGDKTAALEADDLVHSPSGIPHTLWNDGADQFRFLVVKTPRQQQTSRLL
jgi:quercetin dioxygenase-like cupin family protein